MYIHRSSRNRSCRGKEISITYSECVFVALCIHYVNHMRHIVICGRSVSEIYSHILCLWFRASLIYINNCPTRCNTKQSIYYSASSLYMYRVSTTPIIGSTQNCNYSLRYWSYVAGGR